MNNITADDEHNHLPKDGAGVDWQESLCVAWYDPVLKIGGFHHTGMQRVRGEADAWSWIALNGTIVEKYHNLLLPLPDADYSALSIGPFHLTSQRPLTHRRIEVLDKGVTADLNYVAWSETIGMTYDVGGASVGDGHWENFGRVTGTVEIEGVTYQVNADAFQDRSWGLRDWTQLLTYRWNWASFGQDLVLSVYYFTGPKGAQSHGHVFDCGEWKTVRSVDVYMEMNRDGVTPHGSRLEVWTTDGRGYYIRGECSAASVHRHRGGYMMANGCARYEMGGRVGAGFMEVNELKQPTPQLQQMLEDSGKCQ